MPGVKGRSGGPRPGSGRPSNLDKALTDALKERAAKLERKTDLALAASKPAELIPVQEHFDNPEDFLRAVMNSATTEGTLRLNAAKALIAAKKTPPSAPKAPPLGKKAQRDQAAQAAAASFAGEHDDIA